VIRTAILGGGAVTRIFYLPAFRAGIAEMRLVAVVDASARSLEQLGELPEGVEKVVASFQAYLGSLVPGSVDAVIVALPHHLHEDCVIAALKMGLHVFCEKPLGLSSESVQRMHDAAAVSTGQLAVCQPRRSFAAAVAIRDLLRTGWMGAVRSVRWREGQAYAWPAESLAQVLEEHGGGELYDIGAHAFDLLAWWFGELRLTEYSDDSAGGSAAEYFVELTTAADIPIKVELSRLYPLANTVEIETERGLIRWDLKSSDTFILAMKIGDSFREVTIGDHLQTSSSMLDAVVMQLQQFVKRIRQLPNDSVGSIDALNCVGIFDECRKQQQRKIRSASDPANGRAVVTGAGGFIGTRLVEMLDDRAVPVLALARRPQSCVRLARRAVDIRLADIRDSAQLDKALSGGGDVIYHCAVASGSTDVVWQTVVGGTLNVLASAERHGFRRVIVFSSMLALGNPKTDGEADDDSLPNDSELEYAKAKREMERLCKEFATRSRVEVVILRPTCVFGPFGRDFGSAQLDSQRNGEFFLLDSGGGLANLVYVDNLVDAAILAASAKCPSGSALIVNEEEWPMTWAEFFLPQMRRAFGEQATIVNLTTQELQELAAKHQHSRSFPTVFREAVRNHAACAEWVAGNPLFRVWQSLRKPWSRHAQVKQLAPASRPAPVDSMSQGKLRLVVAISQLRTFPYGPFFLSFFTTRAQFRSGRARQLLGWRPLMGRHAAMTETLAWIERAYPGASAERLPEQ
jgi:predicted dehydrogenase/nucleoside-diphosphate-sugar epimerase